MVNALSNRGRIGATGLGLIEVVVAVAVSSVGVITAAGVSLAIGSQARLAAWDTDQAIATGIQLEQLVNLGYAGATSGATTVALGPRTYQVARAVTNPAPRLKHVRVTVNSSMRRGAATFETRLARPRPLPAAP